jgi:hypothetical protein
VAAWHPLSGYRLNLLSNMGEFQTMRWNAEHTLLQPPPLSWPRISVMAFFALLLLSAAIRVTNKQDF